MGSIAAVTRKLFGSEIAALALLSTLTVAACAETSDSNERSVRVVKNKREWRAQTGGISPDKEAEVQLLLQQRDPSTLRCYQDVLDEKHDRAFKGTVIVLLELTPAGKGQRQGHRRNAEQQRGQRLPGREAERLRVPAGRPDGDHAVRVSVRTGVLSCDSGLMGLRSAKPRGTRVIASAAAIDPARSLRA